MQLPYLSLLPFRGVEIEWRRRGNGSVCLNMGKRCVLARYSHSHKDGVSSLKFPTDRRLRQHWTTQIERTRAKWSSRSEHSCVSGIHTSQDCLQEMSSISKNVGMKMKQMLKPRVVSTIFPRSLPNCSPLCIRKTLMNVKYRRGTKSMNCVEEDTS